LEVGRTAEGMGLDGKMSYDNTIIDRRYILRRIIFEGRTFSTIVRESRYNQNTKSTHPESVETLSDATSLTTSGERIEVDGGWVTLSLAFFEGGTTSDST